MTERAFKIDKAVLTFLTEKDVPMLESVIHGDVQRQMLIAGDVRPSVNEMDSSFQRLNAKRWVNGLPSAVRGVMKWSINDAGRGGLLQMNDE